jgi:L-cystine uptake protein TcyP (sodium:dicarboxylate symporter family)
MQELRPEYEMIVVPGSTTEAIDWPTRFGAVTIPRPSERCQADLGVNQAVAKFGAAITTIMGALSCFTAGYWGQVSEPFLRIAQKS